MFHDWAIFKNQDYRKKGKLILKHENLKVAAYSS